MHVIIIQIKIFGHICKECVKKKNMKIRMFPKEMPNESTEVS